VRVNNITIDENKISFSSQFLVAPFASRAYYVSDCSYKITVRGTSFSSSPFFVAFCLKADETRNTGFSSVRKERVARYSGDEARASKERFS